METLQEFKILSHVDKEKIRAILTRRGVNTISDLERLVIERIKTQQVISSNPGDGDRSSFGQRLADRVASFGGSWTFIMIFGAVLFIWVLINAVILTAANRFDPYPFVFLNLVLSMLAAVQAPIIMMSQNRQGEKDRLQAQLDYQINLKAELEVLQLREQLAAMQVSIDAILNRLEKDDGAV